jgi:hypothetical protein
MCLTFIKLVIIYIFLCIFFYGWFYISLRYDSILPTYLVINLNVIIVSVLTLVYSGFLPGVAYSNRFLTDLFQIVNYVDSIVPYKVLSEDNLEFTKKENSYFSGKNYGES